MKKQNRSVIVTGYIGLKGTAILADKYRDKIDSYYPAYLSRGAVRFADNLEQTAAEANELIRAVLAKKLAEDGITGKTACNRDDLSGGTECEMPVVEIGEGGFLTAMWELAKRADRGFTVDLRKVPLKQETVEICELLEVNPYHLCSYGAIVAVVPDGQLLAEQLLKIGIPSTIIGCTNSSKAHILMNDGTESHLNRPEPDELVRIGLIKQA